MSYMTILELAGGLVLLVIGGDSLVRGAVAVAASLGVSKLLIGLTLVGFGTSTPELVTSLQAALLESPGIAVGNVVGSNIANVLLILGTAAVITPIACNPPAFFRDSSVLAGSSLLLAVVAVTGALSRPAGLLFVVLLLAYIVLSYVRERRIPDASAVLHELGTERPGPTPTSLGVGLLFAIGGIAVTILGARLLVDGAIVLAAAAGISETIIGLTVVALGTSLPELVTAVVAALRNHDDVALGNVVGSNIYNVLGILGMTAIVQPLEVPPEILGFDLWVMLGVTALMIVFAVSGRRISRGEGAIFLGGYAAYIAILAIEAARS
jgi:cation:H+ antiporter